MFKGARPGGEADKKDFVFKSLPQYYIYGIGALTITGGGEGRAVWVTIMRIWKSKSSFS
jgi:hypothetical protein